MWMQQHTVSELFVFHTQAAVRWDGKTSPCTVSSVFLAWQSNPISVYLKCLVSFWRWWSLLEWTVLILSPIKENMLNRIYFALFTHDMTDCYMYSFYLMKQQNKYFPTLSFNHLKLWKAAFTFIYVIAFTNETVAHLEENVQTRHRIDYNTCWERLCKEQELLFWHELHKGQRAASHMF